MNKLSEFLMYQESDTCIVTATEYSGTCYDSPVCGPRTTRVSFLFV